MKKIVIISTFILIQACSQNQSIKSSPVEAKPVEAKPVEAKPVETKPVETKPVETKPVETKPVETKPVETKPVETKPVETKPVEAKPVETKPVETKPVETKPTVRSIKGQLSFDLSAVRDNEIDKESTVIYFKSDSTSKMKLPVQNHQIVTQNKRFLPSVLAITKGSSVTFPNRDRILHNVFSVSQGSEFDLGLYSSGEEKTTVFDDAGIKFVHCNVHHSMQADILVLDTPWFTKANENGEFELNQIPQEAGTLYVWHPRAALQQFTVNHDTKNIPDIEIDITRAKVPKHLNKFGKSYRATRD
ncbi:hypothetical protein [Marinicella rhabdoformis]|uniref:hypothetical protein n=1 Tax=Marinicella rhabdoformis TaxID=2580566 RepID=UPI001FEC6C4F|nr:hypothetical protein [Marinicella rhabdoformis]